jgi:1-acyl-sn-glycerol-3-phosphate acyltransferase
VRPSFADRFALLVQREVGRLLGPIWIPAGAAILRWWYGWRILDAGAARQEFRRLRRESSTPLLVCANHLTMVDSFLIAMALASPWWYVTHFAALPWNTPERDNFSRTWWLRIATWVMKCIPVERGGDRREIGRVFERFGWILSRGDVGLIFPEGGRSRSGRVDREASTYGVGRVVKALPGCRVLCVYLRGEGQTTWTDAPARGERFRVRFASLEPKTEHGGMRGSLAITKQVLTRLAALETEWFDARK